jgi:hypothetical protein
MELQQPPLVGNTISAQNTITTTTGGEAGIIQQVIFSDSSGNIVSGMSIGEYLQQTAAITTNTGVIVSAPELLEPMAPSPTALELQSAEVQNCTSQFLEQHKQFFEQNNIFFATEQQRKYYEIFDLDSFCKVDGFYDEEGNPWYNKHLIDPDINSKDVTVKTQAVPTKKFFRYDENTNQSESVTFIIKALSPDGTIVTINKTKIPGDYRQILKQLEESLNATNQSIISNKSLEYVQDVLPGVIINSAGVFPELLQSYINLTDTVEVLDTTNMPPMPVLISTTPEGKRLKMVTKDGDKTFIEVNNMLTSNGIFTEEEIPADAEDRINSAIETYGLTIYSSGQMFMGDTEYPQQSQAVIKEYLKGLTDETIPMRSLIDPETMLPVYMVQNPLDFDNVGRKVIFELPEFSDLYNIPLIYESQLLDGRKIFVRAVPIANNTRIHMLQMVQTTLDTGTIPAIRPLDISKIPGKNINDTQYKSQEEIDSIKCIDSPILDFVRFCEAKNLIQQESLSDDSVNVIVVDGFAGATPWIQKGIINPEDVYTVLPESIVGTTGENHGLKTTDQMIGIMRLLWGEDEMKRVTRFHNIVVLDTNAAGSLTGVISGLQKVAQLVEQQNQEGEKSVVNLSIAWTAPERLSNILSISQLQFAVKESKLIIKNTLRIADSGTHLYWAAGNSAYTTFQPCETLSRIGHPNIHCVSRTYDANYDGKEVSSNQTGEYYLPVNNSSDNKAVLTLAQPDRTNTIPGYDYNGTFGGTSVGTPIAAVLSTLGEHAFGLEQPQYHSPNKVDLLGFNGYRYYRSVFYSAVSKLFIPLAANNQGNK